MSTKQNGSSLFLTQNLPINCFPGFLCSPLKTHTGGHLLLCSLFPPLQLDMVQVGCFDVLIRLRNNYWFSEPPCQTFWLVRWDSQPFASSRPTRHLVPRCSQCSLCMMLAIASRSFWILNTSSTAAGFWLFWKYTCALGKCIDLVLVTCCQESLCMATKLSSNWLNMENAMSVGYSQSVKTLPHNPSLRTWQSAVCCSPSKSTNCCCPCLVHFKTEVHTSRSISLAICKATNESWCQSRYDT